MRTRLLLPLLLLAGCAWEPGEGFAVVEPTVRAGYTTLPSRDAGGGFQRLSSDFQVRVSAASLQLASIALLGSASGGGGGSTTFDPANPPPGYSLCHGGHCHRDDGALIDYEDIQAELNGGGGSTAATIVTLPVGASVDLLAPETRTLQCQPDCELPRTSVTRGRWTVTGLSLQGTVRDSRQPPRLTGERPFRFVVAPASTPEPLLVMNGELDVPSDRENEPRVKLGLSLDVTPAVFDAVDWSATTVGADGVVDLNAPENEAAREALLAALLALQPTAEVQRDER